MGRAAGCSDRNIRIHSKALVLRTVVALCSILLVSACLQVGGTSGEALVFPGTARLGDTVAIAIDSNYIPAPIPGDAQEHHDLSRDNVTLKIIQGTNTVLHTLDGAEIVAVFDGHAAPASIRQQVGAGVFATIVVFNLPTALDVAPSSYPATNLKVRLFVDGVAQSAITGKLTILGTGGAPTDFFVESEPVDLEPRPTLRLAAVGDGTWEAGFEPARAIGGIEFLLEYPAEALSEPEVFPATEASRGLAFLGPEDTPGEVKVFLTDPRGFTLPYKAEVDGVGDGFLLEVAFTKAENEAFAAEDFTIRDLKVTDPDGVLLTPVFSSGTDTTAFFERIVRKNLAE